MLHKLVVYSGGMDSYTLLHDVLDQSRFGNGNEIVTTIGFDYNQRHRRELDVAQAVCNRLGVQRTVIDLRGLPTVLGTSALTNDAIDVPAGHYQADSMRKTVVPGRNTIMLAIAMGVAEARLSDSDMALVYYGAHSGDHHIYPDCRPAFVDAMSRVYHCASERPDSVRLIAPYLRGDKTSILARGFELGLDYSQTWTCYAGGEHPCGVCGACQERAEAFSAHGRADPLIVARDATVARDSPWPLLA
jgi:7-cyano-7-deazaguanine synthase